MLCIYFLDKYKQEVRIHLEIVGIMEFFQLLIKFFFMLNIDGHDVFNVFFVVETFL